MTWKAEHRRAKPVWMEIRSLPDRGTRFRLWCLSPVVREGQDYLVWEVNAVAYAG